MEFKKRVVSSQNISEKSTVGHNSLEVHENSATSIVYPVNRESVSTYLDIDPNDCEILQTYYKIRDSIRAGSSAIKEGLYVQHPQASPLKSIENFTIHRASHDLSNHNVKPKISKRLPPSSG